MFSTNTIAKLAGIQNFVLNEATSNYTDEQIIDLFKKIELGIRQNDELFKLNKKAFGGDKTTDERAEEFDKERNEDRKKRNEMDKAHDDADKEDAERTSVKKYEDLKKSVREYFSKEDEYQHDNGLFSKNIKDAYHSPTNKEYSLDLKPYISHWHQFGTEFVLVQAILVKIVSEMSAFIDKGHGKFKAKDFGDYVNSFLDHQQVRQIIYEKTVNDGTKTTYLQHWANANKDKLIIDIVNDNKELIKLIIKKADSYAQQKISTALEPNVRFLFRVFTIFTRPHHNVDKNNCKFGDALERANKSESKIFIWNQGVYSAVSLEDTINLNVILKGLTKKTLKQVSNMALRSFQGKDLSSLSKAQVDALTEGTIDIDLEDDILNEGIPFIGRKITVDSLHKAWSEEGRPKTPEKFKEFVEDHLVIKFGEKHSRKISELLSKVLKDEETTPTPKEEDNKKDNDDTPKPGEEEGKSNDEPLLKPEEEEKGSKEKGSKIKLPRDKGSEDKGSEDNGWEEKPQINPLEKFGIESWKDWETIKQLVKKLKKQDGSNNAWKNITPKIRKILSTILAQTFEEYQKSNETEPRYKMETIEDLDRAIITEQQCKLAGIKSPVNTQKFFEDLDKVLKQFN